MIITLEKSTHKRHILLKSHKVYRICQIYTRHQVELLRVQCLFIDQRLSRLEESIIVLIKDSLVKWYPTQRRDAPVNMEPIVEGHFQINLVRELLDHVVDEDDLLLPSSILKVLVLHLVEHR